MTIQYLKEKFPPPPYDTEVEEMLYYRDLYEGNHENIFPRAQQLAEQSQQVTKPKVSKQRKRYYRGLTSKNTGLAQYHYVVVNFAAVIAELPADLINRSLGNISADTEKEQAVLDFVSGIVKRSKLQQKIWPAIVQHQVDGGVAYRIRRDDRGAWFEWKPADMYFEHEDELGADIAWIEARGDKKFLRVERQRLNVNQLEVEQLAYQIESDTVESQLDINEYARDYGLTITDFQAFEGVDELMCGFLPNDETLMRPRGRSGLRNIDNIQEEINWTITRDSIVFEKHGKPKLAIPRALWDTVAKQNQNYYGERFVRNADLEVVSYDEKNGAVPMYITWNAMTEQSFKHVERLVQAMMAVSKTSAQAAGIEEAKGSTSAKAILYEWIQSVIKSEAIKDKFDTVIKEAIRKCIVLENAIARTNLNAIEPVVEWQDMLPKADSERDEEEADKFDKGVQSLETTIRNLHPTWSEKAILAELKKIQEEQATDSLSPSFVQPPKTTITTGEEE